MTGISTDEIRQLYTEVRERLDRAEESGLERPQETVVHYLTAIVGLVSILDAKMDEMYLLVGDDYVTELPGPKKQDFLQ